MIAILCKQRNLARTVSELMTEETKVYFTPEAVVEEKVIVIGYGYSQEDLSKFTKILKEKKQQPFLLLEPEQKSWFKNGQDKIPCLINGQDSNDSFLRFIYGKAEEGKRNIVFASGSGGTGKTILSAYLAKVVSSKRLVRLIDWNFQSPSYSQYFGLGLESKEKDITQAVIRLRNQLEINLSDYDVKIGKNLKLSPMYVNYFESAKWGVEPFIQLWDYYESTSDLNIYEVPNHPFSVTAALGLIRATDIVIPILPEINGVENTYGLLKWIRMNREKAMPKIHLLINRYNEESVVPKEVEKTLEEKVEAVIPEIPILWNLFQSGDLFDLKNMDKTTAEKVNVLEQWLDDFGLINHTNLEFSKPSGLMKRILSIRKTG